MYEYEISKDVESFRDYQGMTETELAQRLGIPRSTLHNWKTGKSRPSALSLETVYELMFDSGYRLNALKEQMFKDSIGKDSVILFHGAKAELSEKASLNYSDMKNDFGRGFYLGDSFLQSASFVCNYANASVYVAELNHMNDLRTIEFEVNTDWMLTIAFFRGKLEQYKDSPRLAKLAGAVREADVVCTPIADNRMFQILDEFIDGNITDLQCKSALSATDLGKQYVILSEKGLGNLDIIHHCYLCNGEKREYLAKKEEFNRISTQKVKYVKREFAGKGKYVEEVLA
ncbi:MAG: DUF3990 domain-containing protein [Spirochaetales bacterium]|nr:DUF3990 domain-containing protein [Spirochaetales bacterium]